MFCTNCGKQLAEGSVYCTACGARLRVDNGVQPLPLTSNGNGENKPISPAYLNNHLNANGSPEKGKNYAIASMVLGIISVVTWFFGTFAFISVVCGIIGLLLASQSKKQGYNGGIRTAGFVLSLIGLIGGSLVFIACVACVSRIAALDRGFRGLAPLLKNY